MLASRCKCRNHQQDWLTVHTFCTALTVRAVRQKTSQCHWLTEHIFCTVLTAPAVGQKQVSAISSLNTRSVQPLQSKLLGKNKSVPLAHSLYTCSVQPLQTQLLGKNKSVRSAHCTHVLYSSCWAKTSQCQELRPQLNQEVSNRNKLELSPHMPTPPPQAGMPGRELCAPAVYRMLTPISVPNILPGKIRQIF